jgi:hypothetical protein
VFPRSNLARVLWECNKYIAPKPQQWHPTTAPIIHIQSLTDNTTNFMKNWIFSWFCVIYMCNITHNSTTPWHIIYKSRYHPSSNTYKNAATPIIPATTPVRPPATWFAAPVNCAGREEVAEAAPEAREDTAPVTDAAADEARLATDEAADAAEEARLEAEAAAEDAAEAARLDAEATREDAAPAAEEAREAATEDAAPAAEETIDAMTEGTAGTEGVLGCVSVLMLWGGSEVGTHGTWAATRPARAGRAMMEKRMVIIFWW